METVDMTMVNTNLAVGASFLHFASDAGYSAACPRSSYDHVDFTYRKSHENNTDIRCTNHEKRKIHRSDRELNPGPWHGSPLRYRCATQAPHTHTHNVMYLFIPPFNSPHYAHTDL